MGIDRTYQGFLAFQLFTCSLLTGMARACERPIRVGTNSPAAARSSDTLVYVDVAAGTRVSRLAPVSTNHKRNVVLQVQVHDCTVLQRSFMYHSHKKPYVCIVEQSLLGSTIMPVFYF